ncbi:hypothetical protein PITCH_A1920045 [uncultured Desulfobacterium sp.]|uniref:Uncharacterized protein n=1 Tax=uncultured Desulfobacterium sp. TaxID=201089 RepID=A0A445MW48_9BACT|nr:hypothetical protein PITCH_A1920045 [uncultured Desulfobacterium sp.]
MNFYVIGEIEEIETIAAGGNIRDIMRRRKQYSSERLHIDNNLSCENIYH